MNKNQRKNKTKKKTTFLPRSLKFSSPSWYINYKGYCEHPLYTCTSLIQANMLSKPVLFLYNLHFKVYITPRRGQHAQVFMQTQLPWTFSFGHAICHPEYSFRLSFFLFYSFPSFVLSFVIGSLIIHILWSCARHFPMHFLIGHAITYAFVHDSYTESCIFSVPAVNFVSDFFSIFHLAILKTIEK